MTLPPGCALRPITAASPRTFLSPVPCCTFSVWPTWTSRVSSLSEVEVMSASMCQMFSRLM